MAFIFTTNISGKKDQSRFKYPEYRAGQVVAQEAGNILRK